MKIIEEGPVMTAIAVEVDSSEVPELFRPAGRDAGRSVSRLLSPESIDRLLADADSVGVGVDGAGGLIQQMIAAVLERALEAEMADHLGSTRFG